MSLVGLVLSMVQGLLAGAPIAISFYLFEAGASGRYIPQALWAVPPGIGVVSMGVSLLREMASGKQDQEVRRAAYEIGQMYGLTP